MDSFCHAEISKYIGLISLFGKEIHTANFKHQLVDIFLHILYVVIILIVVCVEIVIYQLVMIN